MIKRIIGVLAILATLAIVVFVALGSGSYKSMLPEDLFFGAAGALEQAQSAEAESVEMNQNAE